MTWGQKISQEESSTDSEKVLPPSIRAVYNHRTGLVDWTGGLDWWTETKNCFYAPNETYLPVGLHDASY